ncbi:VanZ family protein [Fervidobacterium sp.]
MDKETKKLSNSSTKKLIFLVFLSVLLFWIGVIFYFSTRSPQESHKQSHFAYRVIKKIDSILDFSNTEIFRKVERRIKILWFGTEYVPAEMVIRKTAHFGLYFIFGFLTSLTFFWWKGDIIISIILGVTLPSTYAIFDEYNQIFYQRGSSLNDVVIDSAGALFGMGFSVLVIVLFGIVRKIKTSGRV